MLPIASLTKLMTAVVVTEANLPLDEMLTITEDDIDTEKGSRSRLKVGTTLTRGEMLHLALMSSENRAAHALGRTYPGGLDAFVAAMNHKARELGMNDTHYVEPTGPVEPQPVERARPGDAGQGGARAPDHPRAVDLARVRRSRSATVRSSSATPTAWCAARRGTSACRRPATSPKPVAAW